MSEHRIPRDIKHQDADLAPLPTIQEQQLAKWGSNFKCGDCIHAYRVLLGDQRVLQCYEGPPLAQLVQVRTALGQTAEAQKQVWRVVNEAQFCDKFQRDLSVQKPGLSAAN